MYKCIDETGPNETPADTKKCQDGVLKLYQETKGIEKKEEKKGGAPSPAPAPAKAKMFLQLAARDDEDSADETSDVDEDFASEMTEGEEDDTEQSDEEESSDDESASSEEEEASEEEESSEEAEGTDEVSMEEEEAEASEDEDQDEADGTDEDVMDDEDETSSDDTAGEDEEESFVQTSNTIADGDLAAGDAASDDAGVAAVDAATDAASDDAGVAATEASTDAASDVATDAAGVAASDAASDDAADAAPAVGDITNDETESLIQVGSSWKPEADSHIKLYEHPQGSTLVMPCPVTSFGNPEACTAYFEGKADADKCSQITCPKALGVTMKLTCGGGCCPTCWAPDHVIAVDRHTSIDDAAVVDPAPQAPGTCGGVKCFKLTCAAGFSEGHVNGDCCYSCIQGR